MSLVKFLPITENKSYCSEGAGDKVIQEEHKRTSNNGCYRKVPCIKMLKLPMNWSDNSNPRRAHEIDLSCSDESSIPWPLIDRATNQNYLDLVWTDSHTLLWTCSGNKEKARFSGPSGIYFRHNHIASMNRPTLPRNRTRPCVLRRGCQRGFALRRYR